MISLIVAIAENGIIGNGNDLPWHLPADLAYFKEKTTGQSVLMGEKTYLSIGKALPNRRNIVLSDNPDFSPVDAEVVRSLDDAVKIAQDANAFIIGGRTVYGLFLPYVDKLYITWVKSNVDGDVFFPEFDLDDFIEVSRNNRLSDEKNKYDLDFTVYERKSSPAIS